MSWRGFGRFDRSGLPEEERYGPLPQGGMTQTETGLYADTQAAELEALRRQNDERRQEVRIAVIEFDCLQKAKDKVERQLDNTRLTLRKVSQAHANLSGAHDKMRATLKDHERKIKALTKEAAANDKDHSEECLALKKARDAADRRAYAVTSKLYATTAAQCLNVRGEAEFDHKVQELSDAMIAKADEKVAASKAVFDKREKDLAAREKTLVATRTAKDAADAKVETLKKQLHVADAKAKVLKEQLRDAETAHASNVAQIKAGFTKFEEKMAAQLETTRAQCQEDLDVQKRKHARDLAQLREQLETAHRAALDAQAADLARARDRLAVSFVQDHTAALSALEAQHKKALTALRDESDAQIDELIDAHEAHIGTLKNKLRELTRNPQRERQWLQQPPELPKTPTRLPPELPPTPQTPIRTPPAASRRVSG